MDFAKISELFEQAIKIGDPEKRTEFIAQACPEDADRTRLANLVKAHGASCDLVDEPEAISSLVQSIVPEGEVGEGSVIGNYRLLQEIGEGGMGHVYMADQLQPIRRRVAIKVIKSSVHSKQVLARFDAEREALTRLDHPNITRILDAGVTDSGLPYFVMELVRGDSLIEYCDQNQLSIEERIELLERVCLAVHHAHQKGILHRDLKPANVMITMHDGVAVPKVIDFGIAKALDQPLTEQTLFTRYGDMIGTPQYMSPEQAEKSGLDIDVRTDVYSLGVLLYELLTATTPIEAKSLQDKGLLGVLETVRDCDTEAPSVRVTKTLPLSQRTATERKISGNLLKRLLRGELDWITLKALAKDRNARYDSAAAMASDLRNYLNGDSVTAAAPTFVYHAKKMYQRHRTISLALAAVAVLLIVTTIVSFQWAVSNDRLRKVADNNALELKKESEKLEKANEELLIARDEARAAKRQALTLVNEKKQQAAEERAMSQFMMRKFQSMFRFAETPEHELLDPENLQAHLEEMISEIGEIDFSFDGASVAKIGIPFPEGSETLGDLPVHPGATSHVEVFAPGSMIFDESDMDASFPAYMFGGPAAQSEFYDMLLAEYRTEFGNEHPLVAKCLLDSCDCLVEQELIVWTLVESRVREAEAILAAPSETPEEDSGFLFIKARCWLAKALREQGRKPEAERLEDECHTLVENSELLEPQRAELLSLLGEEPSSP